jgi:hypothetical protein
MSDHILPFRPTTDEALEAAIKSLSRRTIDAYQAGDKQLARELDKRRMLAIRLRSDAQIARMEAEKGLSSHA